MAGIINGVWSGSHSIDSDREDLFLNWITPDGDPGPTGRGGFPVDPDRYHLYLAQGCPYSHRVGIARKYFQLESLFPATWVEDVKRHDGWRLKRGDDPIFAANTLHEVMIAAEGNITAKTTVPLLVDKQNKRLVSNSSADIVRMMNDLSNSEDSGTQQLWPEALTDEIDELNNWISNEINSGVYRVVFSELPDDKQRFNESVRHAFTSMDERLSQARYLHGDNITASDIWLYPTLLRFDSVYSEIFGLDFKLEPFKYLITYLQDLCSEDSFASSAELDRIEDHYFLSILHGPNGVIEPGLGKSINKDKRTVQF
jgi:putative glutathione S-transferase